MNLLETLKMMPDIAEHLQGITVDNCLEYVGKSSDRSTPKMNLEGTEPAHTSHWGSKISDALRETDEQLRRYNAAYREKQETDPKIRSTIHKTTNALSEKLTRLKIAHRLAQCVAKTGSFEFPDITVPAKDGDDKGPQANMLTKNQDLGNGVFRPILDCPSGIRLYNLKVWSDELYRKCVIYRGEEIAV